ncbi:MAG: hypothetical protein IPJ65_04545 [Archangiaceae bacterium]|nr:hypothetical protein [Archangiaceae bacterium]
MSPEPIAEDLRAFLLERVRSLEELEVLLLVRGEPDGVWSSDSVGARLALAPQVAEEALAELGDRQLLSAREQAGLKLYRYQAADPAHDALVSRLLLAYQRNRIGVISLMTRNAVERIRGSVLRTFADAFVVGRKKDG